MELNDSFIFNLHNAIIRLIVPSACNDIQYRANNIQQFQIQLFYPNPIPPSTSSKWDSSLNQKKSETEREHTKEREREEEEEKTTPTAAAPVYTGERRIHI